METLEPKETEQTLNDAKSEEAFQQKSPKVYHTPEKPEPVEEERPSIYSPIKNRESFIQRKIRLLMEKDASQSDFGRQSIDQLDMKPSLSRVAKEQKELKAARKHMEEWNGKGFDEVVAESKEITLRKREAKAQEKKDQVPKVVGKKRVQDEWEEFGACVIKKPRIQRDKEEYLKKKEESLTKKLSEKSDNEIV